MDSLHSGNWNWYTAELAYRYDAEYKIDNIGFYTSDLFYMLGYMVFFAFGAYNHVKMFKTIKKN